MLSTIIGIVLLLVILIGPLVLFIKMAMSATRKQFAPLIERFGTSEPLFEGKVLLRFFYTKAASYKHRVWMVADSNYIYFEIPKIGNIKVPFEEISPEVKDLGGVNEGFIFITMKLKSFENTDVKIKDIRFSFRKSALSSFPQIAKMIAVSDQ